MPVLFPLSSWSPAPAIFPLQPGWAYIFRIPLDNPHPLPGDPWQVLSPFEQERALRLRAGELRQHFVYAHYAVRQILATYLRCSPTAVQFSYGPHGKPSLADGAPVRFNLTHSDQLALLAISTDQEIGVDIENTTRHVDHASIARRFFSPPEASAIAMLPPEQQVGAFFACWTRKEAYIKARGGGLSIPLDGFRVSVSLGNPVILHDPRDNPLPNPHWTIVEIDPGLGYTAALAVEGFLRGWRGWDWRP
jgi:4'-phosphopantetheinyl transferase